MKCSACKYNTGNGVCRLRLGTVSEGAPSKPNNGCTMGRPFGNSFDCKCATPLAGSLSDREKGVCLLCMGKYS